MTVAVPVEAFAATLKVFLQESSVASHLLNASLQIWVPMFSIEKPQALDLPQS